MPTVTGLSAARPHPLRAAALFVALVALTSGAHAQNRYEWTVYSALNSVQSVAFDSSGTVWAGTTGGVVGYHVEQDSFEVYRTTDGLMRLNTTAVGVDPATGALYAGASDGSISIRSSEGSWYGVTDVAGVDRADRRVIDFSFRNGLAYVLTAFGVAVFDPSDTTFPETWTRFRSLSPNIPVNDILFWRDSIWIATDEGIARAPERGALLPNPQSWTIIDTAGMGTPTALSLAVIDGKLAVGTNRGAFLRGDDGVFRRFADIGQTEPVRFATSGDRQAAAAQFMIYRRQEDRFTAATATSPTTIQDIAVGSQGRVAIAVSNVGIGILEGGSLRIVTPSAPVSNYFSDIALGTDGSVWTSSSEWGGASRGLSRLRNERWEQYSSTTTSSAIDNAIINVGIGANNTVWSGSYGRGMYRLSPADSGASIERLDQTNSPLTGIAQSPDYVIAGDAAADTRGRTWFLNWSNAGGVGPLLIAELAPDETAATGHRFASFLRPPGISERLYRWIVIDLNGTKWLGSDRPLGGQALPSGLLGFVDNGTLTDENDDKWPRLGVEHGLVTNQQTALALDLDGALWIGSPGGLAVLDNPMTVAQQGAEAARVRNSEREPGNCCRALREVSVSAIAVDALNRKWIGTNQGIFVLSPDGIDVVHRFTVENSPLVDNDVVSLLADNATGDIYIGTSNGLNRVSTEAVESPQPAERVTVWPQPFLLPSDEPARIDGLPPNATVKILTAGGRLVRQFASPGGAVAFWDGRDGDSEPVPSGVYIIAAGASSGEETVVGKIAVIRR